MILGGKRVRSNVPVARVGDRHTFNATLNGTNLVVLHTFTDFGRIYEILIKVPTLAIAATAVLTLHDSDYLLTADARYESSALTENSTHDIRCELCTGQVYFEFDRLVHPGDVLCVRANAAATEVVTGVIYETGA